MTSKLFSLQFWWRISVCSWTVPFFSNNIWWQIWRQSGEFAFEQHSVFLSIWSMHENKVSSSLCLQKDFKSVVEAEIAQPCWHFGKRDWEQHDRPTQCDPRSIASIVRFMQVQNSIWISGQNFRRFWRRLSLIDVDVANCTSDKFSQVLLHDPEILSLQQENVPNSLKIPPLLHMTTTSDNVWHKIQWMSNLNKVSFSFIFYLKVTFGSRRRRLTSFFRRGNPIEDSPRNLIQLSSKRNSFYLRRNCDFIIRDSLFIADNNTTSRFALRISYRVSFSWIFECNLVLIYFNCFSLHNCQIITTAPDSSIHLN